MLKFLSQTKSNFCKKKSGGGQTQTAVTFVLIVLETRDLDRDVRLDEAFLAVPNAPHITLTVPELFGFNRGGNALFGARVTEGTLHG